jgi:predicted amidophosphoribosyltransferase
MVYYQCAICEKEIPNKDARELKYFCWRCYNLWLDDILSKENWVVYLINEEQKRRYRITYMTEHHIKEPISLSRLNLDKLDRRVFIHNG